MLGIIDRYIGKTIFAATFLSLFVLIGLSSIIKFVEQMKNVGQGSYDVFAASYFVLLKMPVEIAVFFPMAALIGALIGLGSLASSSELVVMQAAGLSKLRIAGAVLKTAIPMVLAVMFLGRQKPIKKHILCKTKRAEVSNKLATSMVFGSKMVMLLLVLGV